MKKINLTLVFIVLIGNLFAQTITKTANKTNAYIGEEITYTISVCGVTHSNQLASIVDDLGAFQSFVSCDIASTSINSAYAVFCPGSLPNYSMDATTNVLTINFPNCNFVPVGTCFSFKIVTQVTDTS